MIFPHKVQAVSRDISGAAAWAMNLSGGSSSTKTQVAAEANAKQRYSSSAHMYACPVS